MHLTFLADEHWYCYLGSGQQYRFKRVYDVGYLNLQPLDPLFLTRMFSISLFFHTHLQQALLLKNVLIFLINITESFGACTYSTVYARIWGHFT